MSELFARNSFLRCSVAVKEKLVPHRSLCLPSVGSAVVVSTVPSWQCAAHSPWWIAVSREG